KVREGERVRQQDSADPPTQRPTDRASRDRNIARPDRSLRPGAPHPAPHPAPHLAPHPAPHPAGPGCSPPARSPPPHHPLRPARSVQPVYTGPVRSCPVPSCPVLTAQPLIPPPTPCCEPATRLSPGPLQTAPRPLAHSLRRSPVRPPALRIHTPRLEEREPPKMPRGTSMLFLSLLLCFAVTKALGLVSAGKEKRGWTLNSAGYLLGPYAVDSHRSFSDKLGLAGKRQLQTDEETRLGTWGRPVADDNIVRTVVEFLTFLRLKDAGVLDLPLTASSEAGGPS
uniref:Galanin peptides n=2 Tax=Ornithorhynchus anatinus TaxID=9258 RepID=A0A6I8NHX1_ORNAN